MTSSQDTFSPRFWGAFFSKKKKMVVLNWCENYDILRSKISTLIEMKPCLRGAARQGMSNLFHSTAINCIVELNSFKS